MGALIPTGRKRRFGDFLADGSRGGNKGVVEAPTIAGDIVSVGSLDGVCCLSVTSGILPNCNGFAEDSQLNPRNNRECHLDMDPFGFFAQCISTPPSFVSYPNLGFLPLLQLVAGRLEGDYSVIYGHALLSASSIW